MNQLLFQDAFVKWDNSSVTFGNKFYSRKIDISKGYPETISLSNGKTDFAVESKNTCDATFLGINMPGDYETSYSITAPIVAEIIENTQFDSPHIKLEITFGEAIQKVNFTRIFYIYPDFSGYSVRNAINTSVIPNCYWTHREALSGEANTSRFNPRYLECCADSLKLAKGFRGIKSIEFKGRTDYHNEMTLEHNLSEGDFTANGNLLFIGNENGDKLVFLQEAPPSTERRDFEKHDFRMKDGEIHSCCWGIAPEDLRLGETLYGYRHTTLLGTKEDDFSTMAKKYMTLRYPMKEHEAAVLVNPWGCGHFPEWTSPAFMLEEIKAAGKIGAEIYQIDDAWEKCLGSARETGIGLAEMTSNNRAMDMEFWEISPDRLPDGFEPAVKAAKEAGIKLGLWCAPSYTSMYNDWEKFSDMLLDYHRKYGFATVKIDGVRLQRHEAEVALESLLRRVRTETCGKVYFNLDTTNGQRPGYFYFLEYGNIFLENRYLYSKTVVSYHPEKVLHNLWDLAKYVRTQTLQIEVPAPDDVPQDFVYERDPRDYDYEYWCAIALFANILVWTAPSRVCENTSATLTKMIKLHKEIRPEIFASTITSVGNRPDGKSITGFESSAGYLLYFRELGAENDSVKLDGNYEILAGKAEINNNTLKLAKGAYALLKKNK